MEVSYPLLDPKINTDYPTRYCFHTMIMAGYALTRSFGNSEPLKMVEVGLGFGDYSVYLMESLSGNVFPWKYDEIDCNYFKLYSIDNWNGRMMRTVLSTVSEKVLSRFEKYDSKNFEFVNKPSVEAANDFEDESLDFVYLDANHKGKEVLKDLKAWWPKVKKGGIFCGHDYAPYRRDGVRRATYTFFTEDVKRSSDIWITSDRNPHPSWGIYK